jgi:hypothetical protein
MVETIIFCLLGKDILKVEWACNFVKYVIYGYMSVPNNDTQISDCVYHAPILAHLTRYIVSDF